MLRTVCLFALAFAGPAAAQGAAYYPSLGYGQAHAARSAPRPPQPRIGRPQTGLRLPDSFFTGAGGVGPTHVERPANRVYVRVLPAR